MAKLSVSVIICSYNPKKKYLDRTLSALNHQGLNKSQWELLLVDNNSDTALSETYNLSWHPNAKHVVEKKQGVTAARLRGISEAKGELLIFVDDDNILSEDYLEIACSIADNNPDIGAFGGSIKPEFKVDPEPKLLKYTGKLALRTIEEDKITNSYSDPQPYGAGLAIRKEIATTYAESIKGTMRESLLGRVGQSLGSAQDIDLAYTSIDMGYNNGLFTALELIHIMPRERLNLDYLSKIRFGINYSGMLLRFFRFDEKPPKPYPFGIRRIKHLLKKVTMSKIEYTMYMASEEARKKFFDTINKLEANKDNE